MIKIIWSRVAAASPRQLARMRCGPLGAPGLALGQSDRLRDAGQVVLRGTQWQARRAETLDEEVSLAFEQRAGIDGKLGRYARLLAMQLGRRGRGFGMVAKHF